MLRLSSSSIKLLAAAGLFGLLLAAGAPNVSAQRGGGLKVCPSGWRPVTPPQNPVLLCLPDTLVLDDGRSDAAPPEGTCPEGWSAATPPLNPVLGCLPDTVVRTDVPKWTALGDGGTCPDGWRPATHPLSPVLGCLPDGYHLQPTRGDQQAPPIPPGSCPLGWVTVTQPLNPLLVCLPSNFSFRPPSSGR